MRRKIVTIVMALVFLAAICIAEQLLVRHMTREAMGSTQEVLQLIKEGALDQAYEKSHALDEAWDEHAKVLEVLVDHGSTDDVRYALSRLLAALESGDAAASLIYAGELEGSIEHVCERQALTVENTL